MEDPVSIAAAVSSVLRSIEGPDATAVDDAGAVWTIKSPGLLAGTARGRAVEDAKKQIVRLLAETGRAVISPSEDPDVYWPGVWKRAEDGSSWKVPADLDVEDPEVFFWLFNQGSWALWAGTWRGAARPSPDLFRTKPAEAKKWIADGGPDVLIQSFYDDTDWVVLLRRT